MINKNKEDKTVKNDETEDMPETEDDIAKKLSR